MKFIAGSLPRDVMVTISHRTMTREPLFGSHQGGQGGDIRAMLAFRANEHESKWKRTELLMLKQIGEDFSKFIGTPQDLPRPIQV
jgi:hypothetical protein